MDIKTRESKNISGISRRQFIGSSTALVGGALLGSLPVGASAYAGGSDVLKVVLIGSGSRGVGAAMDALRADEATELVAIADVFQQKLDRCYEILMHQEESLKKRVKVPQENRFLGLDSYKKVIEMGDVVILATPPAFRPLHFETAVNAGKHVFMEKPLSTDAPGARRILASGIEADQKGLCVVVGLQNRYAVRMSKFKEQIDNGLVGDITSMSCNYMMGRVNLVPRQPGDNEIEYQLRNWRYFEWLWGGSPAGLTIHFEDITHWIKGSYPVRAIGMGGRSALSGPEHGDVYDNHYIEYEYEDGIRLHSRTRNINGAWSDRSITIVGSEGEGTVLGNRSPEIKDRTGKTIWSYDHWDDPSPFQVEHDVLFKAIRSGKQINDTEWGGKSNMTSILGRMAVQSGHQIAYDEALQSDLVLVPDDLDFHSTPPAVPGEDGNYPVIVPGSRENVL